MKMSKQAALRMITARLGSLAEKDRSLTPSEMFDLTTDKVAERHLAVVAQRVFAAVRKAGEGADQLAAYVAAMEQAVERHGLVASANDICGRIPGDRVQAAIQVAKVEAGRQLDKEFGELLALAKGAE